MSDSRLLSIRNLRILFPCHKNKLQEVVKGISLEIREKEWVCLVGESGSGKSQTALALTHLEASAVLQGEIDFYEADKKISLIDAEAALLQNIRGKGITYIFQNPHSSFNPVLTIGEQMVEVYRTHYKASAAEAKKCALAALAEVHLPEPKRVFDSFAHELSGGMKQRAAIATALILNARLLVADEPTTALDATIESGIIEMLEDIRTEWPFSVLFITHDLALATEVADRIYVMKSGEIVECLSPENGFKGSHPYTQKLFRAAMQEVRPKTEILL